MSGNLCDLVCHCPDCGGRSVGWWREEAHQRLLRGDSWEDSDTKRREWMIDAMAFLAVVPGPRAAAILQRGLELTRELEGPPIVGREGPGGWTIFEQDQDK